MSTSSNDITNSELRSPLSKEQIAALMAAIIESSYPAVFETAQKVISVAEDRASSVTIQQLKTAIDKAYNAIERLYYKEKIVLFPFLEKHYGNAGAEKFTSAITNTIDESMRIVQQINSIKHWTNKGESEVNPPLDEAILSAFALFEGSWWNLCIRKEQLFASFLPLNQIKD
jgi:iron-sulfur cluster repair protein YtfE (RIC family)